MYDVNPDIYGSALSLDVGENDNSVSFELAIETAKCYDISIHEAKNIVNDIQKTVCDNWRTLAVDKGLSRGAINRMEPAFAMEYK